MEEERFGIFHSSVYTFSEKTIKGLRLNSHRLELLELIRKDFIAKKCKLLFGLCEGCQRFGLLSTIG